MEIGSVRLTGPAIAGVPRVRQRISTARGSFAPFPGSDGGPPPGGPVPARLGAGSPPRQSSLWTGLWGFWGHPRGPLWIQRGMAVNSRATACRRRPLSSPNPVHGLWTVHFLAAQPAQTRAAPPSPEPRAASLGSPEAARLLRRRAGCRGIFRTRVVRPGRARLPPGRPVLRAPAAPAGLATLADLVVQRGQFLVQGR